MKIPRKQYADLFGPTKGDRVRLADTELLIEIEKDFTSYGDEAVFGGGKVLRDGMGQSPRATSASGQHKTNRMHHKRNFTMVSNTIPFSHGFHQATYISL